MASPFSLFRRHQKVLMVLLVVMAMFAFTLDSLFSSGQANVPLLGLLLGAGVACCWGLSSGRPLQYTIIGAVCGLGFGFVGPMFAAPNYRVSFQGGGLTQEEVNDLMIRRNLANRFMQVLWNAASEKAQEAAWKKDTSADKPPEFEFRPSRTPGQFLFGPASEQSVVLAYLLRQKADELDVEVNDALVRQSIQSLIKMAGDQAGADATLSSEEFVGLRDEVQYGPAAVTDNLLLDVLKDEYKARFALQMLMPSRIATPDYLWQLYCRLHIEQNLEGVSIPVEAFVDQVGEPKDGELQTFFEDYKERVPNRNPDTNAEEPGAPGFIQPPRLQLAFLEIDFNAIEKSVTVTDEEIQEYYDTIYSTNPANQPPVQPDPSNPDQRPLQPKLAPDDASGPELKTPDAPQPPADKPAADKPAADKPDSKPDKPPLPVDPPAPSKNQPEGCQDDPQSSGKATASAQGQSADEKPADDKPADKKPADDKPAADKPADDKPADDKPADDKPDGDAAQPNAEPGSALDDLLKQDLREKIRENKTQELLRKKLNTASDEMTRLRRKFREDMSKKRAELKKSNPTEQELEDALAEEMRRLAGPIQDTLTQFAKESTGMRYVELDQPLSRQEMRDQGEDFVLGSATILLPGASEQNPADKESVIDALFASENQEYNNRQAQDDVNGNMYVFWVTKDVPVHVPTYAEVKDQVETAWNLFQAGWPGTKNKQPGPAKQRAQALKAKFEKSTGDLDEVLQDITLTGEPDDPSLESNYIFSAPFRWMETSSAPGGGMAQRTPQLSRISGIDTADIKNADNRFMKTVFEDLGENDWGITYNFDRSVYYVVRPQYRRVVLSEGNEPENPENLDKLRERFVKDLSNPTFGYGSQFFSFVSPIPQLVQFDQQKLAMDWRIKLEKEFKVKFLDDVQP